MFFTTSSYPKPNANGACVNQILLEMKKRGLEVHLICKKKQNEPEKSIVNGIHIYRVKDTLSSDLNEISSGIKNIKVSEILRGIAHNIHRFKTLLYFPFFPVTSLSLIIRIYKLAVKLHQSYKFDMVYSSYNPIEGLIASNLLKRQYPDIKLGMYLLDSLSNKGGGRLVNSKMMERKGWKWERRFYKDADLILNMIPHKEHHKKDRYIPYRNKMAYVDIPLLTKSNRVNKNNRDEEDYTTIVYSGSLNSYYRDPTYACEVFKKINDNSYRIKFYSRGDCEHRLSEYQEITNGMITRNGYIPHEELLIKLNSASILLSIGNKKSDMLPSKIFEYMSLGKPIIHFYDDETDSSLPYLKKYSLALLIKQDLENLDENTLKVKDFIRKKTGKEIDFSVIENTFKRNTPEYTVDKIVNM